MNKEVVTLITPSELQQLSPATNADKSFILNARHQIKSIVSAQDTRLLVIVGPCSIHNTTEALVYAQKLKEFAAQVSDRLLLVMRVYLEKPRSVLGWKGFISDPNLDGSYQINDGLKRARSLLLDLAQLKLPAATEFLDPIIATYLNDLISWAAIGARTTQSQRHRELASGLPMAIGFKNTTDGNIQAAVEAVIAAQHPHHYLGVSQSGAPTLISTMGNAHGHIVLRGSENRVNYHAEDIEAAIKLLKVSQLPPRVMVDASHGNSVKDPSNQARVIQSVANQLLKTESIFGVMLESNLIAGKQNLSFKKTLNYGQSITDGCMSWDETKITLTKLYEATEKVLEII